MLYSFLSLLHFNVILSSTSILFLAGSIALTLLFRDNPSSHRFAVGLFLWFLALAPLRWIANRIDSMVAYMSDEHNDNRGTALFFDIVFVIIEVFLLGLGVVSFLHGL
jgi:hypothetical protein